MIAKPMVGGWEKGGRVGKSIFGNQQGGRVGKRWEGGKSIFEHHHGRRVGNILKVFLNIIIHHHPSSSIIIHEVKLFSNGEG